MASAERQVSLCELLDRVLNKGAVLTGEVIISVADIELLYVGINLLISSVETLLETADGHRAERKQSYEIP
ncbi:MAG: gas vesicle protein [Candidatus Latescibacteria bacterium]|nr:gas vesicle protein [Candidatus Latescibacterota bacterium]